MGISALASMAVLLAGALAEICITPVSFLVRLSQRGVAGNAACSAVLLSDECANLGATWASQMPVQSCRCGDEGLSER